MLHDSRLSDLSSVIVISCYIERILQKLLVLDIIVLSQYICAVDGAFLRVIPMNIQKKFIEFRSKGAFFREFHSDVQWKISNCSFLLESPKLIMILFIFTFFVISSVGQNGSRPPKFGSNRNVSQFCEFGRFSKLELWDLMDSMRNAELAEYLVHEIKKKTRSEIFEVEISIKLLKISCFYIFRNIFWSFIKIW